MPFVQPDASAIADALLAPPGGSFELAKMATRDTLFFPDKEDAKASAAMDAEAIDQLQDTLYAEGNRALLLILQGMDTAGKSGTIKSVFRATSPLGMKVTAFKKPSTNELARDYLWRVHNAVPPKGHIGIFDRSHYEDVLVARVRNLAPIDAIEERYEQINAFEKHLTQNGVTILKCFLHFSKEEQGKRLRDRLERPHKRWKFNQGDLEDRQLWAQFMKAYEIAVQRCSTEAAPWYVIPSD
ncbi:MAG: PPK2 family polyphosphate kinase, partial [Parvularcula sp.]|nr:PPK2 family polyphosphate kinase [Parvularcula sp.]